MAEKKKHCVYMLLVKEDAVEQCKLPDERIFRAAAKKNAADI